MGVLLGDLSERLTKKYEVLTAQEKEKQEAAKAAAEAKRAGAVAKLPGTSSIV